MKSLILFSIMSCVSLAAINTPKELEILSLPYKNQMETFKNDQKTYNNLIAIAKDNKIGFSKRWKAIIAAAELRKDQAMDDLLFLSLSKEWFVKNAVLVSLKNIHHPKKIDIIKRLLKDPSLVVRSAAVDQIIYDGVDSHRDILWEELFQERNKKKNQSLWIRTQIIKALSSNPRPIEKSLFLKLLNEKEQNIQNSGLKGAQKLVFNPQQINELASEKISTRLAKVKNKLVTIQN